MVYGEIPAANAPRTIDPKEWATPPWEPVLKDGRIWARSASDDKAPIAALTSALDALICDGPVHQSCRQQIVFGARGVTGQQRAIAEAPDVDAELMCELPAPPQHRYHQRTGRRDAHACRSWCCAPPKPRADPS